MSMTLVNSAVGSISSNATLSSPVVGNLILLAIFAATASGTPAPSFLSSFDGNGDVTSFTLLASIAGANATAGSVWLYAGTVANTINSSISIEVTMSDASDGSLIVMQFSGVSSTLDGSATTFTTASAGYAYISTSGLTELTTTNANDLLLMIGCSGDGPTTPVSASGFTLIDNTGNAHLPSVASYQIVSAAQTNTPAYVHVGANLNNESLIALALKAAVAAPASGAILIAL